MSFIKITSKEQRDALAKLLHDVKQNIKASQLKDRLDKLGVSRDLGRFFKPVVDAQEKAAMEITKNLPPPRSGDLRRYPEEDLCSLPE